MPDKKRPIVTKCPEVTFVDRIITYTHKMVAIDNAFVLMKVI